MSRDALKFLEDERAAWRPFEALLDLSDADLSVPLDGAHGWSGRDLMAHLSYWQELGMTVARELALHETSETKIQSDVDWDGRGGEAVNEEVRLTGLALPMDEVRSRFRLIPDKLRGELMAVPESRWLENTEYKSFLLNQTTDHYAAHMADLAAVLAAAKPTGASRQTTTAAQGDVLTTLPAAMTGRASPAKAALGDKPVFAYISSLPQPQRAIAERVDALAARTLPTLQRSVKWGMAWYGVGDGWCFASGGFAGHVKLTFGRGTSLTPVPPVAPIGMGKDSRGVDLESVDDLDERQLGSWMKQAAAIPGFGKRG